MRNRVLSGPLWLTRLITGSIFGVVMSAWGVLTQEHDPWFSLILGVGAGVAFGLVMGTWVYRQNQRALADTGGRALDRTVRRAAIRGPVPADDEDRLAALALVRMQADQLRAQRSWVLPFYGVMTALATWQALQHSPWWWFAVPLWVVAAVGTVWTRRRLARRHILLSQAGRGPSSVE